MKRNLALMVFAVTVFTAASAFANTSNGTEFQSIYDRVMGWVTGLPAIVFGLAIGILGALRGFQTGQYFWIFGGLIIAAFVFVVPTIMTGLGGATF